MKKQTILKCAISIFLFAAVQTAWAGFLFVDVVDGNDLNDGLSWEAAFATIQKGIDEAVNGDTVTVADGVYTGTGNRDIDFKGKAIAVQSDSGPENCIIDANGTESEPHRGFYFHSGEDASSILSGFTITNGYALVVYNTEGGSAIKCQNSSPLISNCIIRDNAGMDSGAIICQNSSPLISECIICDNICREGGAITQGNNSSSTITNCIITRNITTSGIGDGGGIIGGGGTISNCVIAGNQFAVGGGVWYYSGSIINCSIVSNRSMYNGGGGAGVYWSTFWPEGQITNCIIWGNTVEYVSIPKEDVQIFSESGTSMPAFSCIQDWERGDLNNIVFDPCFVSPGTWEDPCDTPEDKFDDVWVMGDYHLKSMFGRWDPNQSDWLYDTSTSPCIDAGDPNSDWTGELWPHGTRINMGAYGGTPQASMSPSTSGQADDLNNDYMINLSDLPVFGEAWSRKELLPCAGDVDRNTVIDISDLQIVGQNWLTTLNQPPRVRIVAPPDGEEYHYLPEPETIVEMEAQAWSTDCTVVKVEFFVDDIFVGQDSNGGDGWTTSWHIPSSWHIPGTPSGYHNIAITAKAIDDEGAITTSEPSRIIVHFEGL